MRAGLATIDDGECAFCRPRAGVEDCLVELSAECLLASGCVVNVEYDHPGSG